MTGSINQHGEVQAVGGVNEKIEGYFDICKSKGLTGKQAVIIPASNVKHLMLRDEVIEAASKKKFHIYPIHNVDEAIELLTDLPAGKRNKHGQFPIGSINSQVEKCLEKFYKTRKQKRIKIVKK